MALVYKALRDENNNVVFICLTGKLSIKEKIDILSGKVKPSDNQVCLVRSNRKDIEIPSSYSISKLDGGIKELNSFIDTDVLVKDLNPNIIINPRPLFKDILTRDVGNWIMHGDKALCTFIHDTTMGVFSCDGSVIHYREENNVRIMRDTQIRHKADKEYVDLTINTDTGLCFYSYKKFDNTVSVESKSKFNMKYRVWENIKKDICTDIISVKRL